MIRYKYKLNHLLSLLPEGIYPEYISAYLEIHKGIVYDVFEDDRRIKYGSEEEIPKERLKIYSDLFKVSEEDLLSSNKSLNLAYENGILLDY